MERVIDRVNKEFDHKFKNNPVFRISPEYRSKIKSFIQQEIDLAVAKREQDIVCAIEDLRGFPANILSDEQATYVINLITI